MMKYYAVYDSKVGVYEQPFLMRTKGEAIRSWVDVVNDEKTKFNKHPEDFTLMELGEYDDEKGQFINLATGPVAIGVALEFLKKEPAKISSIQKQA